MNNLDNYYHEHYREELGKAQSHHSNGMLLLKTAMVITFILYALFCIHLYIGNGLVWDVYMQTREGQIWLVSMLVIVSLLSLFLAWIKHFAYKHFSRFAPQISVVFTVVAFALFAEFFSSSANQDAKSSAILAKDSAYQQTVRQQTVTVQPSPGLAADIAKAEQRLARCQHNLKRGKEKHCDGDKAKLESLKQTQNAGMQMQVKASKAMQQQNFERQDKLKADSYNPTIVSMAKVTASLFGGNYADYIKPAILLIMIIVAAAFEKLHHFLIQALREAEATVQHYKRKLAEMQDGQNHDHPDQEPQKQSFGFVPPTPSQPATAKKEPVKAFKWQIEREKSAPRKVGFVDTDSRYSTSVSGSESTVLKQAQNKPESQVSHKTINHETNQYVKPVLKQEKESPTVLAQSREGETGSMQQDSIAEKSNSETVLKQEPKQPRKAFSDTDLIYPEWKMAVKAGQCKLTVRPCRDWVKKQLGANTSRQVKKITESYASQIVELLYQRGLNDGVILKNRKWKEGTRIRKYLLAGGEA